MRLLLITATLAVFASFSLYAQWIVVNEPDFDGYLQDVHFVSADLGWLVGDDGMIYKTEDGGLEWTQQNSGTTKDLCKIFFVDENVGWAGVGNNYLGGEAGSILRTTNGGETWSEVVFADLMTGYTVKYCDGLFFLDANVGFVLQSDSKNNFVLKTTDGGLTWAVKDSNFSTTFHRWRDVEFGSATAGAIVGDDRKRFKYTTDGGETWLDAGMPTDFFFGKCHAVRWLDASTAITVGEGSEFHKIKTPAYKTTNAGETWTKVSSGNAFDRPKDAYVKDDNNLVSAGSNGFSKPFFYTTTNAGDDWTPSSADYAFGLRAVSGSGDNLVAVGTGSHVVRSSDFGATWTQPPLKPISAIVDLEYVGGVGYAITRNGDFLRNFNGAGHPWRPIASTGKNEATDMAWLSADVGFVSKENRHIVRTTDGGYHWNDVLDAVAFNTRNKAGGIDFGDASVGYAWFSVGDYDKYEIWKTTDAGDTWTQSWTGAGPGYISGGLVAFDADNAAIVAPDHWILHTTDGGATWNEATISGDPYDLSAKDFEDAFKIDGSTAYAVGDKNIQKTTDKGATWNYLDHGVAGIDSTFYTVAFEGDVGYVASFSGEIMKTEDGGASWEVDSTFVGDLFFYSAAFADSGKATLGTSDGTIVGDDVTLDAREDRAETPAEFSLAQNYPNPFNPTTTIRFSLDRASDVSVVLYDMLGRRVRTIFEGRADAGEHAFRLDATGLASGTYLYRLSANGTTLTKKALLLK